MASSFASMQSALDCFGRCWIIEIFALRWSGNHLSSENAISALVGTIVRTQSHTPALKRCIAFNDHTNRNVGVGFRCVLLLVVSNAIQ